MKNFTIKIAAGIILLSSALTGCNNFNTVAPSNNITSEERYVIDYSGIEVSNAFTVDVTFSNTEDRITVEANENLHQYIIVEKFAGNLRIDLENRTNIRGRSTLKVHIVTSSPITYLQASNATKLLLLNELATDNLTINVSDASYLSGKIKVNDLEVFVEDASEASLEGAINTLTAQVEDASSLGDYDLVAEYTDIKLSNACNANMTINSEINIRASGASTLRYKGNAMVNNINLTESSSIIKVD